MLYATVSGKTKQFAQTVRERLLHAGVEAEVHNVARYSAARLRQNDTVLIFATNWGAGAPPPDAVEFCHSLEDPRLKLTHLKFAVFELSSRLKVKVGGCGLRIDAALRARGAKALLAVVTSDRRSYAPFEAWYAEIARALHVGAARRASAANPELESPVARLRK